MVDFAVVAGYEASGFGAAAVAGVADDPLVGGGQPPAAAQVERSRGVVVEHGEVVDALAGQPDQVAHGQAARATGSRRRRHGHGRIARRARRLLQLGQRRRHHNGHRRPAVLPEPAGGDRRLEREFDRVMAALLGASRISLLGVGLMPARAHRRGDRLEIRAGLGVQPAGEPAHAVGPLPTQHQPAPPGAILVGEVAVGIEAVGDGLPDHGDELRILFPGMANQCPFGLVLVGG